MENNRERISVLIADHHPVTRQGLALVLDKETDLLLVAQASDEKGAYEAYRECRPDVAVLDLPVTGADGFAGASRILGDFPQARILLFTTCDGDEDIYRAMQLGVRGYVLKETPCYEISRAIRTIHWGGRYLSSAVGAKLADSYTSPTLSERERKVLRLVAEGKATKEICFEIGVSASTVKTHLASVMEKLGAKSRAEVALVAQRRGFLRG